ncbi:hypothetical protein Tco_0997348 [Tanacetum coccineum]
MHNNIMAAGSRDHPPMLATGRYAQWRSWFLRYIDTRPNGDALRKCILEVETVLNMSPENEAHFESEKEAIHLILTGNGDEIYSTVDACKIAHEMWEAIERLQQGESLNIQDVKTNLFWEFRQFTSHDGETIKSYYTMFYKLMNEMIRNNLTVATMQVNVQFLQQLQPEWSRFVTIVKQQHKLDEVSYHKLFDILKQYQKEVNELRAKRIAKTANPLALVATAQPYQYPYYQTSKSHKSSAPTLKASLPTRSHATTRHKGKETAKPIIPLSESASVKRIKRKIAKIWLSLKNDNQTVQFGNQRKELGKFLSECRMLKPGLKTLTPCTDCDPIEGYIRLLDILMCFAMEIQHSEQSKSISNTCVVETGDSNVIPDSLNMCDNDIQNDQNDVECDDERVALANLIANLKLNTELEKYMAFNDRTVDYGKLEHKLNETLGLLAQKDIDIKEGLKLKAYEISIVQEKHDELVK